MYINNGHIRVWIAPSADQGAPGNSDSVAAAIPGLDANGDPVAQGRWSEPIEANIRTISRRRETTDAGNHFTTAAYEVLIAMQVFDATRVRLQRRGCELGQFEVQDATPLGLVEALKITV